jgi:transposase
MSEVIREGAVRVGVDLAKRVIQVHAVDSGERVLTSRALARDKFLAWCARLPAGCIVAMEASSSAHHWARKLLALGLQPRIISAQLVSPYARKATRARTTPTTPTTPRRSARLRRARACASSR